MQLTPGDWIQFAIAVFIGGPILAVGIKWCWRLGKKVGAILREVTPNGGSSMKDQVGRLEGRVSGLEQSHTELHESQRRQNTLLVAIARSKGIATKGCNDSGEFLP